MKLTRADKALIGVLIAFAALGMGASVFFYPTAAASQAAAEVWVDGRLQKKLVLRPGFREELRLGGSEHYNIIEADNGRVRIREADCPDQVCTRTGWIKAPPEQIVCLPHKVVIKITSSQPSDIDDMTR